MGTHYRVKYRIVKKVELGETSEPIWAVVCVLPTAELEDIANLLKKYLLKDVIIDEIYKLNEGYIRGADVINL